MTVFALAKEGAKSIECWDDDIVSSHNVPMSLYGPQHVGRLKVEALRDIVALLTGTVISAVSQKYRGETPLRNCAVVSCVDGMKEGRGVIWKEVKGKTSIPIFCDSRMAATYTEVISVQPFVRKDIERYEKLFFDDKEAVRQTCGEHGIIYGSMNAARVIAANVASIAMTGKATWRFAERCDTLQRAL